MVYCLIIHFVFVHISIFIRIVTVFCQINYFYHCLHTIQTELFCYDFVYKYYYYLKDIKSQGLTLKLYKNKTSYDKHHHVEKTSKASHCFVSPKISSKKKMRFDVFCKFQAVLFIRVSYAIVVYAHKSRIRSSVQC